MTEASNNLTLQVGGLQYGGWKTARAQVGMDRAAGSFELDVTELWPGEDVTRRIRPGDACRLAAGGDVLVTGYVDAVDVQLDGFNHQVTIRGRDSSADLIDCSAIRSPGQWFNRTVLSIAQDLAEPFKVKVTAEVDVGKTLASFALQEGETAFDAIDRAGRLRGLMLMSNGVGGLVLTHAGLNRCTDALVLGGNVLTGRSTFDVRDRFSVYTAKGQAAGTDFFNGKSAAHAVAKATDPQVTRYRPLLLTGEAPDASGSLVQRVKWEATVRAARSMTVQLVVQGWRQQDGTLWKPNHLVHVVADALRLDQDLLISSCEYSIGPTGLLTTLALTRPDAYTLEPIKPNPAAAVSAGAFWDVAGARR